MSESVLTPPQRVLGVLWRVNRWLHYVAGAALVAILGITVANIIGREIGRPVEGSVEMTQLFMGLMVFLAFGYGEGERVHISVDLVYEQLGSKGKRFLRIFGRLVGLVVVVFMVFKLWDYAGIQQDGSYTTGILTWPIWPFVRLAAVGAFMLALTMLANLVADIFGIEGYAESDDTTPVEIQEALAEAGADPIEPPAGSETT